MTEHEYHVCLNTPLGKKHGIMTASTAGESLTGTLEMLGHKREFVGVVDGDGVCTISGAIVTLLKTITFTAEGKITDDDVYLRVRADNGGMTFELSGRSEATV